jgi:hypothetical protein
MAVKSKSEALDEIVSRLENKGHSKYSNRSKNPDITFLSERKSTVFSRFKERCDKMEA